MKKKVNKNALTESEKKRLSNIDKWAKGVRMDVGSHIKNYWERETYINYILLIEEKPLESGFLNRLNTWDRDMRTAKELFLDFIRAWLQEDHLLSKVSIELNRVIVARGDDNTRKVEEAKNCRSVPDMEYMNPKTRKITYIEIMTDNAGYIAQNKVIDLREHKSGTSKLKSLLRLSEAEGTEAVYLLIYSPRYDSYILQRIDERVEVIGEHYSNTMMPGKLFTRIKLIAA